MIEPVNITNDAMYDIGTNLSANLEAQFPELASVRMDWPDAKWCLVDGNLPTVSIIDIGESGRNAVSREEVHRNIDNGGGTGTIAFEIMRLRTLIQVSLFANDKLTRDQLGGRIKQYLILNTQIPIFDYTLSTPVDTGETIMLYYRSDHRNIKGEANFWRRDLTFEAVTRVLNGLPSWKVIQVENTNDIST